MSIHAQLRLAKISVSATLILLAGCQSLDNQASVQQPTATTDPAITEPAHECPPMPEPKKVIVRVPVDVKGKRVFGSVEQLQVPALNLRMNARIDTGATSSSLHARELTTFERDGKPWVRFIPGTDPKAKMIEMPVVRTVRIKNKAGVSSARPVVQLKVTIGPVSQRLNVNLADRGKFEYAALIGRDFLKDVAIVDVSQQHIAVLPAPRIQ